MSVATGSAYFLSVVSPEVSSWGLWLRALKCQNDGMRKERPVGLGSEQSKAHLGIALGWRLFPMGY